MKRGISLYIGGTKADLDEQALVLFNYAMEDLSNPTIVKNSYSKQVTLKGTPTNNDIFGHIYKTGRTSEDTGGATGVSFNPSRKTPFTIYNELNEIIESGYIKLDEVSNKGGQVEYKITLFGGLGSFFYSLGYNESGDKRTLADLKYLNTGDSASELDFYITKETVSAAWNNPEPDEEGYNPLWDVINFAPAYNGIPENFAADKGVVRPADIGLATSSGDYNASYTGGYCLVNLANEVDEWAVKDLRSYLQRPVFSMKAFWEAICNPSNNGGFEVDTSGVSLQNNIWMTLPMLTSLGVTKSVTSEATCTLASNYGTDVNVARVDINQAIAAGSRVTLKATLPLLLQMPSYEGAYSLNAAVGSGPAGMSYQQYRTAFFLQLVAYDNGNEAVGASQVKVINGIGNYDGSIGNEQFAQWVGYSPDYHLLSGTFEQTNYSEAGLQKVSNTEYSYPGLTFSVVEARDAKYYRLKIRRIIYIHNYTSGTIAVMPATSDISSGPHMWKNNGTVEVSGFIKVNTASSATHLSFSTSSTMRSGALITKKMLLSTSQSPADYMISFCKIFGLSFLYDNATKKVTVVNRNALYQDETIDLTDRIDSKQINIKPLAFDSKWYQYDLESYGGAWEQAYKDKHGRTYGSQRVNTGYDFSSEVKDLLSGSAFKKAATILARSKYFIYITSAGYFKPSPFIDKGNTYTLWDSAGSTTDIDIPCPPANATVEYFGETGKDPGTPDALKGFDVTFARKMEFRDSEGKPLDGSGVLVYWEGTSHYEGFKLTDDTTWMDVLNDGTPCWDLTSGPLEPNHLAVPIFQQYQWRSGWWTVDESLDFGMPAEMDIPSVEYDPSSTIYEKGWKAYISDRYDVNTRVMTCKADLSGLQVGQGLLRKFFWYQGAIWVLNKISNYSLTTDDLCECEFVKVNDKANYLNGQDYGNN